MSNTFEWKTNFKSTIIVDNELFQNDYHVELTITPNVADLKEQSSSVETMKQLQNNSIFGGEAKPLPFLLCQMNMLLHNIENPNIVFDTIHVSVDDLIKTYYENTRHGYQKSFWRSFSNFCSSIGNEF